jgi:AMMECR1 domain-containing protein
LQSGCFLPQVATEMGWDKIELLRRCCQGKAGLPPDAWKDPATEVSLFTAEAFSGSFRYT